MQSLKTLLLLIIYLNKVRFDINMISIILVEPKTAGNIGAIARVMKNFGFDNLILVNPKCDHLSKEAFDRASHAKEILNKAKIIKKIPKLDYLVATSSCLGTDYNIPRSPINPEQLAEKISKTNKNMGIVFGKEDHGLNNKEVSECDFIVAIPTSVKYAAMNLSHSVAVVLYEISKKSKNKKINDHITEAGKKEKDAFLKIINKKIKDMKFSTKEKEETQIVIWKRLIGKSFLTKREIFALFGFLRKLK